MMGARRIGERNTSFKEKLTVSILDPSTVNWKWSDETARRPGLDKERDPKLSGSTRSGRGVVGQRQGRPGVLVGHGCGEMLAKEL
jgi:hypothetical protein